LSNVGCTNLGNNIASYMHCFKFGKISSLSIGSLTCSRNRQAANHNEFYSGL